MRRVLVHDADRDAVYRARGVETHEAVDDVFQDPLESMTLILDATSVQDGTLEQQHQPKEGRYVARAILAEACGAPPPRPFWPRDKGTMAVIGSQCRRRRHLAAAPDRSAGLGCWLTVHIYR